MHLHSITRRLILSVLLAECIAAAALIAAVTVHEQHVQYKAFDANLRGTANVLWGAVEDADDVDDNIMLDLRGVKLPHDTLFHVQDDRGRVLGSVGTLPPLALAPGQFGNAKLNGRSYRFYMLTGDRFVDPAVHGGVHHQVHIVLGMPDHHVWHEVFEAIRFYAIASVVLLSLTGMLLAWLIRRLTSPIHQLAAAADAINIHEWEFLAPAEARGIAELEPLIQALEGALARLQRSFEQQRRFTSDAAHELKTDLAIVKSSFQLLAMRTRTNEEYERGIALGLQDLARLEATVQKMLTLARLEQSPVGVAPVCRLDQALEYAVRQATPAAQVAQVTLSLLHSEPASIACDVRDAQLLCSNMLMNAIQYSPKETTVRIECRASNAECTVTVADAGHGVDESEIPFLFHPFYRGDPSRSRISGGTGLGLAICRAICDRAGGHITIANNPEGGAVVTVKLPLASVVFKP